MDKETWHHIIPTSRWWLKWTNNDNTILLPQKNIHTPLHKAFGNALPNEQLLEVLRNPTNKIKDQKKEELYDLLWITSYHKIYLPWVIADLDDFYWKDLRVWEINDEKKLIKYQENFFTKENDIVVKRLLRIYEINKQILMKEFSDKLLGIIN
jgi:hypothetical protein